ncbi:MAG: site-2 protease family protein, partial [Pirellulales bacterium]
MGWSLIAVVWNWELLLVIIKVSAGLGAVIFVHELGHFLVAKACGVKCEKFYIGFDIGGWKICRQWGETEYGIGILPLGGYVKMLGQDDNPAKIAEEMERSRIVLEASAGKSPIDERSDGEQPVSAETEYVLDPRSYLAKSVPQRMAIISAGVVMNLIFAVIFAAIAYGMGVSYQAPVVSDVLAGSPAWRAGLQAGDEIIRIGDMDNPRFSDLQGRIALGDLSNGVPAVIRRVGRSEPISVILRPEKGRGLVPTIGILGAYTLTVRGVWSDSAAAEAEPELKPGDQIVAVDGERVERQADLIRKLITSRDRAIELTVRRAAISQSGRESDDAGRDAEELKITVPRNPLQRVGLAMEMGPITAIKSVSPAASAGLEPGDRIVEVDGEPVGDPITWPLQISKRVGETIALTILRGNGEQAEKLQLDLVAETAHS